MSGGDSPLTAGSPENSGVIERRFADEPLYQFYTAAVVEVSYSIYKACATWDCVMDSIPRNASSDIPHAVSCLNADGYMVLYLREC